MNTLDLFSGIGGFTIGFEKAGFKTIAFCEIEKFCQNVLNKNYPGIPVYPDIKNLTREKLKNDGLGKIDVITGGFPCQDLSVVGNQKGINGNTRSGLWWEMWRLVGEIRPKFAVMENVPNFLHGENGAWFGDFLRSLAEIGYDAEWSCISAAAVGKAHLRERVWIVAYPDSLMLQNSSGIFKGILSENYQRKRSQQTGGGFKKFRSSLELLPENLRMDDGILCGMDEVKERIKALGNSIVPEIAYLIAQQLKGKNEG